MELRKAVRRLLDEPDHVARAAALQAEMRRYDGPGRAAGLLEQLAATRAPVVAGAAQVAV